MNTTQELAARPAPTATGAIVKLNLGAGSTPLSGYVNLDKKTGDSIYPLDYADESIDEIRASHVLEHFSHRETMDIVRHWVSKLKPGGLLKIAVPDFGAIANHYMRNSNLPLEGFIMGGHVDEDDHHGAIFDMNAMCALFKSCGLERVAQWLPDADDCSKLPISLNVQARKPAAGPMEFKGVRACLASARYCPAIHHRCIYEALSYLRMRIHMITGCFWQQNLSNAMEAELKDPDCRYILTLDFDTVFSHEDVAELYRIMETHPHIDALVSLQSKRGGNEALFTMADDVGKLVGTVEAETFQRITARINTGHFGLTMIRADKLREFPRPWMCAIPAPDGTWGEGHIDADITFWNNWNRHGNTVYLANHVAVGHVEELVMWPGQDFGPVYQKSSDYINYGKPMEAR